MQQVAIGDYLIRIPDDIVLTPFECTDYYGVQLVVGGVKYDVLANQYMGERILISEGYGSTRDMPFHLGTAGFLPTGIEVTKKPVMTGDGPIV